MKSIFYLLFILVNFSSFSQEISVVTQQKTVGSIKVLTYSNDGNLLATGGEGDYNIKVWDIASGKVLGVLNGHDKTINDIKFNQTGTKMISCSEDKKVMLWDILKWEIIDSITLESQQFSMTDISDNKFYTNQQDGQIFKWNFDSFRSPEKFFKIEGEVKSIKAYQKWLIAIKKSGSIALVDLEKKALIIEKKLHQFGIVGIGLLPKTNSMISCGADGKILKWSILDLAESQVIASNQLSLSSFNLNEKKEVFAVATANKTIKVFDLKGTLIKSFKSKVEGKSSPIKALEISPDGSTVASSGTEYTKNILSSKSLAIINIWDLKRGIIYKTLKGEMNPIYAFDFHPNQNKLVLLNGNHTLSFWDLDIAEKFGDMILDKPERKLAPKQKSFSFKKGKNLLNKASQIASGNYGVVLRSGETKSIAETVVKRQTIEKDIIKFSSKGKYLITKLRKDDIKYYDLSNRFPKEISRIFSYQSNINGLGSTIDEKVLVVIGSGDSAVSIVDLETGNFIKRLSTPGPSGKLGLLYEAQSMAFSPDGKYLAVGFNNSKTFVWNTENWTLAFENVLLGNLGLSHGTYVNFTKDSKSLIINTFSGIKRYSTEKFSLFKQDFLKIKGHSLSINQPCDYAATIKDNYLYFENLSTGEFIKSIYLKPKSVSSVSSKSNGKIGLTLLNGQFFILDPKTGEDDIMLVEDGDHSIIKTHENYYKVTKSGFNLVTFRIGNKAYPFEQFDAVYNRPDYVLKKLNCKDEKLISLYESIYLKRIKKLGLNPVSKVDLRNAPTAKVLNADGIKSIVNTDEIELSIEFKDQKALYSYNIWVNGVPKYSNKGKTVKAIKMVKVTESVELLSGMNKIQVACRNREGSESLYETFYVKNTKVVEKNLYVLSIGTSKYQQAEYNLNYAEKDANDLAKLFQSNTNKVYDNVHVKTMFDEAVKVEDILKAKAFLEQANTNDIVVVFIAGHGVLDEEFNYFFATHFINFFKPNEGGLAYVLLESLMEKLKAMRKILIMDTCHSGEIDKEEVFYSEEKAEKSADVSFRSSGPEVKTKSDSYNPSKMINLLYNDLRKGTGATVLSSAGGTEFALESDEWKNGLFSYCLLSGLRNNFADLNKDGEIYLSELQNYVVGKVKALSKGKQIPNTRIQNIELDFRIW